MNTLFNDANQIVLAHLRAYRDHLDSLIKYLGEIKEHQDNNSMFVSNPAPNAAPPAGPPPGSYIIGTIGDEPQPPPIPTVKVDVTNAPGLVAGLSESKTWEKTLEDDLAARLARSE